MQDFEQWRVLVCETLTGRIIADVQPADYPSFERVLSDKGSWQVPVLVHDKANRGVDLHTVSQDRRYCWAICWGDYIVQAGPVWGWSFADESRTLTVSGSGMFSLFNRRLLRHPYHNVALTDPAADLPYETTNLGQIVWWLVEDSQRRADHRLPIDMPAVPDTPGEKRERHYHAYDMATFGERMTDLSEVINGPDFDFSPFFTQDGKIQWRLLIGNPKLGDLKTPAVWDYGAALEYVDVECDASEAPAYHAWVKGSGNEKELKYGHAWDTSSYRYGVPPNDFINGDHTSTETQATLDGYAQQDIRRLRDPVQIITASVRIDGDSRSAPRLGHWSLGDAPTFAISGHPWLGELSLRSRIIGFSNDTPATVKLELDERT